jgi:peptide methionine sulfoxide reductase MsrA
MEMGHAEAIENSIPLKSDRRPLEIFCNTRSDYINRQRNDVGTQYRSEIFHTNEEAAQSDTLV